MEDTTSAAFGSNSQLYTDLGEPNADAYNTGSAVLAKVLGKNKKMKHRKLPETVFLTGKQKKLKKFS